MESTSDATSSREDMLLESFSLHTLCCCRSKRSLPKRFRCLPARLDSLRFDGSQVSPQDQARCAPLLSGVDSRSGDGGELLTPSARAVAAAIRRASIAWACLLVGMLEILQYLPSLPASSAPSSACNRPLIWRSGSQ